MQVNGDSLTLLASNTAGVPQDDTIAPEEHQFQVAVPAYEWLIPLSRKPIESAELMTSHNEQHKDN